jgi:hypothetical protein
MFTIVIVTCFLFSVGLAQNSTVNLINPFWKKPIHTGGRNITGNYTDGLAASVVGVVSFHFSRIPGWPVKANDRFRILPRLPIALDVDPISRPSPVY